MAIRNERDRKFVCIDLIAILMCCNYFIRRPLQGKVNAVFLNEIFRDVMGVVAHRGSA